MKLDLASFAQDVLVRAIKTFAQTLVALIVADGAVGIMDVNWGDRLSVAGLAALLSVLTTIASGTFTRSPAVGEAVTPDPQVVAKDTPVGVVAGPASPLANDTPVAVVPVSDAPTPPPATYDERGQVAFSWLIGVLVVVILVVVLVNLL